MDLNAVITVTVNEENRYGDRSDTNFSNFTITKKIKVTELSEVAFLLANIQNLTAKNG